MGGNFVVCSDLHFPYEHGEALSFIKTVKKEFRVPDENMLCVGDETDQYFASLFKKSPNAAHSPKSELCASIEKLKAWYAAFPLMKLATSNHAIRWWKRATEAEIPDELIRQYRDVICAPRGWQWQDEWLTRTRYPFRIIHGMGYSGINGHRNAALDGNISTAIGHLHSHGGVSRIRTSLKEIWGMNVGCLIDEKAYAFDYSKHDRIKPTLGCGVVLDDGKTPLFVPL